MTSATFTIADLRRIARLALQARGLLTELGVEAAAELARLDAPAPIGGAQVRDLRGLPWCSIDHDDSRDLDQLTVAVELEDGAVSTLVAVADVDALVARGSALDRHASHNTASVYTVGQVFPMLPPALSADLSSLREGADRLCVVTEFTVKPNGAVGESDVSLAAVNNHAKLAYATVGAWLDGRGALPEVAIRSGIEAQLVLQDRVAQQLRQARHERGALDFAAMEARPVIEAGRLVRLEAQPPNRARWLVEELMIATNSVVARYLEAKARPSLRRTIRSPAQWHKIVDVATKRGEFLPGSPSPLALEAFLAKQRVADPAGFAELSLTIIKLIGKAEYTQVSPGSPSAGHFGLSLREYVHSTAPNRRFADLVTQRLLKAALSDAPSPYTVAELDDLARHCTARERAIAKVERRVSKSAAALALDRRIGDRFLGIVTGAAAKGTWVRIFDPLVEGRLVAGFDGLEVGDKVEVILEATDFEKGHLDFRLADAL